MHKTQFVQKKEMHNILLVFDLQRDHVIQAWRVDLVFINK